MKNKKLQKKMRKKNCREQIENPNFWGKYEKEEE